MRKVVIGYIFSGRGLGEDEDVFLRLAKKKNIELIMFETIKGIDEKEILEKIKKCDLIYNGSAEDFAVELEKTIETLGKKVIDSSDEYYYSEDKWLFYLECKKHKIPTPETILFLEDFSEFKKLLEGFNHWPVILKRVQGTMGEFVEKAENFSEAEKVIKHFWEKGDQKMPVIAQRFIKSPSYRVTVIDKKIVQTALKTSTGWKATGVYAKRIKRFKVNKSLRKIVDEIINVFKINICGIDFLKENGKWIALEINSGPAFDFFECDRIKLIDKTLNFLRREALKSRNYL